MKIVKYALLVVLFTGAPLVNAEQGDVKFTFELGVHSGGDEITTAETTSGTENVTAGGGISAAIGAKMDLSEDLMLQATIGFKEDSITGSNGDVSFSRNTLDFLVDMKMSELIYLGGGLTYHMSPELTTEGAGAYFAQNEEFENALGYLLDAKFDVGVPGDLYVSLRMTFIDYDSKTAANGKKSYNGNSVGLIWGGHF